LRKKLFIVPLAEVPDTLPVTVVRSRLLARGTGAGMLKVKVPPCRGTEVLGATGTIWMALFEDGYPLRQRTSSDVLRSLTALELARKVSVVRIFVLPVKVEARAPCRCAPPGPVAPASCAGATKAMRAAPTVTTERALVGRVLMPRSQAPPGHVCNCDPGGVARSWHAAAWATGAQLRGIFSESPSMMFVVRWL
jgi:hypothetical protein